MFMSIFTENGHIIRKKVNIKCHCLDCHCHLLSRIAHVCIIKALALTTSFLGGLNTFPTSSPLGKSRAEVAGTLEDCDLLCCGCATCSCPWSPNLFFSFSVTSSVTRSEREEQEEEVERAPPSLSLPLSSERRKCVQGRYNENV